MRGIFILLASACFSVFADANFSKLPPPTAQTVNFSTDIKPIFEQSCFRCHNSERPKSHFRLDNRESALKGGTHGAAILPGDSTNSPLLRYVARLDPDMLMPPEGKGEPLTTNQVALLREWIDQGAPWDMESSRFRFSIAPAVGFSFVQGNKNRFREHWGLRNGWRGGVESFAFEEKLSPDATLTLSGRAMTDDYLANLLAEKRDLGFIRLGFGQFRKYDSDTGGYFPAFSQPTFSLDSDLHQDFGRAWIGFGLTLPDWPQLVLGYEYNYRNGDIATLQWGPVSEGVETRAIFPAYKSVDDRTHILKFDLDYERAGWSFADSFRGEWTELRTDRHNVSESTIGVPGSMVENRVREGWRSFHGANTVRVERQFKDWLFGSAGYLYSHLSGDADFSMDTFNPSGAPLNPIVQRAEWRSQRILLERESHVGNVNALLGPWQAFTLALGVQGERTRQNGTLDGTETSFIAPPFNAPPFSFPDDVIPVSAITDIDKTTADESALLNFTRLPFTTLFAEARLQQENLSHNEDTAGDYTFTRHTEARSDAQDFRAGFDTSPLAWLKIGSHYRYSNKTTSYDDGNPANDIFGYSTFIESREITTKEIESRLTLRPCRWLKTTFTHRLLATDYHTSTESLSVNAPGDLSPGGRVLAGEYDAQIFSLNATFTPWRRLQWFASVSYQDITSMELHDNTTAVAPYRGDTWTAQCHGRYALNAKHDLTAGCTFSAANFRQDNFADGLPLGMSYRLHGAQVGLVSRVTKKITTKLQYGFYQYTEPSSGGANDYTAHAIFASLNLQLP